MPNQHESATAQYIPVEEWRTRHDLGRTSVYQALRRGQIPHVRIGRRILIPENALDRMVSDQLAGVRKGGGDAAAA